MADDTFTISRLYKGDEDAFRYIFDNEYGLMCSFANRMLHDRAMAESIADDVIFNLWESHERLNITSSLRSYLLGAVRNRCINELKSRIKRLSATNASLNIREEMEMLDVIFTDGSQPLGTLLEQELEEQISQCISLLSKECREVFEKSRFEGLSYKEIASELNISTNTVKYHIKQALSFLHSNLDGYQKWIVIAMLIR